jgi:hemolysin activation/secretion protein
MSRIPNTSVIVNAAAPKTVSGGTPLDVAVNHPRNWNVDTSVDARRGEYTGFINATINGLTSYNEQLGIATLVPFKSDSRKRYLGLNYQQAVNDDGLQFSN